MKLEYKCQYCGKKLSALRKLKQHEEHTCKLNPNYVKKEIKLYCKFCNKEVHKPGALGVHERTCSLNPERKPLTNNGNGWIYVKHKHEKAPYGTWKCEECNLIFDTKRKLYEHKYALHNLKPRDTSHICEFCGEHYDKKREHYRICSKRRHPGNFKWTDEEKQKISNRRKEFLKNHPDEHPWKKSDKFKSKPCEHLKEILRKDFNFEEEYTDTRWEHSYSLDIAFLDKKIAIEVNGNQHYNNDGTLTDYYQKRHDYLESKGWIIIELHYAACYKNDKIIEVKDAIINCKNIDLEEHKLLFENKQKTKKEKYIKKYNWEEIDNINYNKIINSGIDLTKNGWVKKVTEKTGLTRRQIYRLVNKTKLKEIVYRRN